LFRLLTIYYCARPFIECFCFSRCVFASLHCPSFRCNTAMVKSEVNLSTLCSKALSHSAHKRASFHKLGLGSHQHHLQPKTATTNHHHRPRTMLCRSQQTESASCQMTPGNQRQASASLIVDAPPMKPFRRLDDDVSLAQPAAQQQLAKHFSPPKQPRRQLSRTNQHHCSNITSDDYYHEVSDHSGSTRAGFAASSSLSDQQNASWDPTPPPAPPALTLPKIQQTSLLLSSPGGVSSGGDQPPRRCLPSYLRAGEEGPRSTTLLRCAAGPSIGTQLCALTSNIKIQSSANLAAGAFLHRHLNLSQPPKTSTTMTTPSIPNHCQQDTKVSVSDKQEGNNDNGNEDDEDGDTDFDDESSSGSSLSSSFSDDDDVDVDGDDDFLYRRHPSLLSSPRPPLSPAPSAIPVETAQPTPSQQQWIDAQETWKAIHQHDFYSLVSCHSCTTELFCARHVEAVWCPLCQTVTSTTSGSTTSATGPLVVGVGLTLDDLRVFELTERNQLDKQSNSSSSSSSSATLAP